nr:2'-5' RNA ligase [uncultured bacterium]
MADKRIFIAIDISDEARQRAADHIAQLRRDARDVRIGWEKSEKLHLTIKFLGSVTEKQLDGVDSAVATMAHRHKSFSASLGGSGVFPNPRQPRVLWLGIASGLDQIGQLAEDIEATCQSLGFKPESRFYSPHLTIARIREPKKGRDIATLHLLEGFSPVTFEVDYLTVYESRLGQHGSTYSVISRHPLAT